MRPESVTVFAGSRAIARGDRDRAAAVVRELLDAAEHTPVLVFDDASGTQVDLDLRGPDTERPANAPAEPRGPGRPRLGVIGREVTLLPRHWEWLASQPGGASVVLRRLVERAIRDRAGADRTRRAQEAAFRFMTAIAGNEPGFEEACRALFACDGGRFGAHTAGWPGDVAAYARTLAGPAFGEGWHV